MFSPLAKRARASTLDSDADVIWNLDAALAPQHPDVYVAQYARQFLRRYDDTLQGIAALCKALGNTCPTEDATRMHELYYKLMTAPEQWSSAKFPIRIGPSAVVRGQNGLFVTTDVAPDKVILAMRTADFPRFVVPHHCFDRAYEGQPTIMAKKERYIVDANEEDDDDNLPSLLDPTDMYGNLVPAAFQGLAEPSTAFFYANEPPPGARANAHFDLVADPNGAPGDTLIRLVTTRHLEANDEVLWYYGASYRRDYALGDVELAASRGARHPRAQHHRR